MLAAGKIRPARQKRSTMNNIQRLSPLLLALLFPAFAAVAMANTTDSGFEGCKENEPHAQIEVCTRLINLGTLPAELIPDAYNNRGMAKIVLGDVEGGVKDLDHALSLEPEHEHAHLNRGYAYIFLGDLSTAKRAFERAMQVTPFSAEPYIGRALASIMNGEAKPAINDLDKAIKFEPRNIIAYINRGCAHRMNGETSKAIADFEMALKIDPQDPDAQRILDELMLEQNAPTAKSTIPGTARYRLYSRHRIRSLQLKYVLR